MKGDTFLQKNIIIFKKIQNIETTFGVSIINFIVIIVANMIALFFKWFSNRMVLI